jgi:hypothetical protein
MTFSEEIEPCTTTPMGSPAARMVAVPRGVFVNEELLTHLRLVPARLPRGAAIT